MLTGITSAAGRVGPSDQLPRPQTPGALAVEEPSQDVMAGTTR